MSYAPRLIPTDLSHSLNHVDLEAQVEPVEIKLKDLESIKNLISGIQVRTNALEERYHQAEQNERIGDLELHGFVEHPNESLNVLMVQVGKVTGVPVQTHDIVWVGHVGSRDVKSKPRVIVPKFKDIEMKNALFRAAREGKGVKLQDLGYADNRHTVYVISLSHIILPPYLS